MSLVEISWAATILILSLLVVAYCSRVLIRAASTIGDRLRIGQFATGFVILSVMTSLPEMLVAVFSVSGGVVGITLGDLFGSNIVNIAFVTSLTLLVGRKKVPSVPLRELASVLYFSSLVPLILSIFEVLSGAAGLFLITSFAVFAYLSITRGKKLAVVGPESSGSFHKAVFLLVLAAVGTIIGARFTVDSATNVAELLGVARLVIGAKVVALGTSLPELLVTMQAARQGRYSMALGNSIGSNLTNMTLILGTVFLIAPLEVNIQSLRLATTFVLIVTSTFWYFLSRGTLGPAEGAILLSEYSLFLILL